MTGEGFAAGYDPTVIVDGHVVWALLTEDVQADLLANFPHQGGLNEAQEQAWLDQAYYSRYTVAAGADPGNL